MKKLLVLLFLLLGSLTYADVTLPRIFGNNMVLQRDKPITIWGWASPKEKITVKFNKQSKSVIAGNDGRWKLQLLNESAGGPFELVVQGKNIITFTNVLVGDVWVCSGQSNMEWTVNNSNNAAQEIKEANYANIRHIKIPNTVASTPQEDIRSGEWKVASPETVGIFTAVGYFFARELVKDLNIPIGLINTTWGGTHVETWTSREAFEASDEFKSMIAAMPRLNLDSLAKARSLATTKKIESMQGPLPDQKLVDQWKRLEVKDGDWRKMNLPGLWEGTEVGDFDGVVWFRKHLTLSGSDAGKAANLRLAMIDDTDETFVNGVKVGETNGYNLSRSYTIEGNILKEGDNVIAVRVNDTGGGGGIYGVEPDLKITIGNNSIPLAGEWLYRIESISKNLTSVGPNSYPTLLYNAMLKPLMPIGIKGVIWYQGESNAGRAFQYRKAFPLMINDWRKQWGQGDFPFYFVQLASFNSANGNSKNGSSWAELREAQTATLSLPNTGMAVTTDIGEPNDIHPRNKQDVGKRLAAIALANTYGRGNIFSGPTYKKMEVNGDKVVVTFDNAGSGLTVKDKYGYLKGFEIAGPDKVFRYAKAYVAGNTVIVSHDEIKDPVAVRFGWADDASDDNLFNKEGFPAAPFRTDNWPGITEQAKFSIGK